MRTVFADASYLIALLNPRDGLHDRAVELSQAILPSRIVTSEMVLVEVMYS
jgi:predicted nucleic acid-binding protein